MQLPFFSKNKLGRSKNYLGLFLKEEEGTALVLYEDGGKMEVRKKERFHYSNGWEHIVQDIDEVLFRFEKELNISLDQTIFFVYSHFIDEKVNDIKKPYIQKIKEIVKNLELHALGYIECSEAVLRFLEKKEEMPLTAILVELDKTNVGVFVYKGGRMSYRKVMSRTNNLIDDLLKAFEGLKGKFLLPARLILYNSKDLDDESTKILTYHWSEDYFIQLPRVEVLKEEETIEGLMSVFQEQLMKEGGKVEEHVPEKKEVLGFVIGEDIQEEEKRVSVQPDDTINKEQKPPIKSPFFLGINFKELVKHLRLPNVRIPKLNISKRLSIVFGIIFIVLSLTLNELFFHKAVLTIYFPSDSLSKTLDIKTSLDNTEGGQLPVFVSTSSATFTDSKVVTGKRDIGEKAKGGVTLYNFDDKEKIFTKGTVLVTSGLPFSLDNDVKVATASLAPDGSAKLPGKNTGGVTASDIGPEGNLSKSQRFKIDDLLPSIYFAINESALSGGTRKQVQTVAKSDIDDLKISIMNKAKNPSAGNQPDNLKQDTEVITQLSKIELRDIKFSKETGEEADSVTIQETVDTVYFYLKKSLFLQYLLSQLSPEVKNGFTLDKDKIVYTIDSAEKKTNTITLHLSVKAKAIKQVPKDELIKHIAGKNKNTVESILKKQYQADGFELLIKEPLPLFNSLLPFLKNNIRIVISSL